MANLILKLVTFLLSLLHDQPGPGPDRISQALGEAERALALARQKARAIGDVTGERACMGATFALVIVRAELKPRPPRVRLPKIKVVWSDKEKAKN